MGKLTNFREVLRELKHTNRKEKTEKICPKCASPKIFLSPVSETYPQMYGIVPSEYVCSNCGYRGPLVLEQIKEKEEQTD